MNDDRKNEIIGKTVFSLTYLWFALKFTAVACVLFLILLYFIDWPLWLAPILAIASFLLFRLFRRFVWTALLKFVRWANRK